MTHFETALNAYIARKPQLDALVASHFGASAGHGDDWGFTPVTPAARPVSSFNLNDLKVDGREG